ncbi:MAG TPA: branched-chain amino acid ABC transporter permease [Acidimicrobiales bacterium]|nr:branched-chain amino acid ABC transporter permease [Acidimicrobiales bacterium]
MTDLVQVVVSTATVGSALTLVALGYGVVFAATGIVNFAQGPLLVVAGYGAFAMTRAGLPVAVAFPAAVAGTALAGAVVEVVALRPLRGRRSPGDAAPVLTTFAVGLVAIDLVRLTADASPHALPPLAASVVGWRVARVAGVAVTPADVLVVAATLALVVAADVAQRRTRAGRALRAVSSDREAAALVGVNPQAVVTAAFAVAGALAAVAAVLLAPKVFVRLENGLLLGLQGFVAAVLGGLGSARGALVGGWAVAGVSAVARTVSPTGSRYELLLVFGVFLAVLAVRPTGLLGARAAERA